MTELLIAAQLEEEEEEEQRRALLRYFNTVFGTTPALHNSYTYVL